jgi:hypothetical protein
MKIEKIKSVLVIALSLVIGLLLEIIAPEIGGRNLISFGMGTVSIAFMLFPALGIVYDDTKRGVSIKVFAWIMFAILLLTNVIFACFKYEIDVYITLTLLMTIVGILGIYILLRSKPSNV